jgi:hypothetical protein
MTISEGDEDACLYRHKPTEANRIDSVTKRDNSQFLEVFRMAFV